MAAARPAPLVCPGHSRTVVYLDYSPVTPDGVFLISACLDGKPMLRRGDNGDWVGTFEGHKGAVWSAVLDSAALRAATGAADFTAKMWDALTGKELYDFTHGHIVKSVHFSPDSTKLLTGCQDKKVRSFDLNAPSADPQIFEGHTSAVRSSLYLQHRPEIIVSGGADKCLRVWDTRTGSQIQEFAMDAPVTSMELSRDCRTLTATAGKNVYFLDPSSELALIKKYALPTDLQSASLHPNGDRFVAGGSDVYVRVFDYASGEEIECNKGHHGPVHAVRFCPHGDTFASGADDGTVRIWTTPSPFGNVSQSNGV